MSRARPQNQKRARLLPMHALLVGASLGAFSCVWQTHAQEAGMRGAVDEQEINEDLLFKMPLASHRSPLDRSQPAPQEQSPVPPYRPTTVAIDEPITIRVDRRWPRLRAEVKNSTAPASTSRGLGRM